MCKQKLKLVDYSNSDVFGQTNKIQFLLFQRPLLSYQNVPFYKNMICENCSIQPEACAILLLLIFQFQK